MPHHRTYTDEQLKEAIKTSINWSDALTKLGLYQVRGVNIKFVRDTATKLGIDFSHFTRRGRPRLKMEDVLVENCPLGRVTKLKYRLYKAGLKKEECEECERTTWNDKPIPLELDHINGNVTDNRIENLRILCCNCHAQTPTHSKRK